MDCRFLNKWDDTEDGDAMHKGDFIFGAAYRYSNTIEHGAEMFEKALDEYIQVFERHRRTRTAGWIKVRKRIPFLLAALGHDDLAITEVSNNMSFCSMGSEIPTPRTKYDDPMEEHRTRADSPLSPFISWPAAFVLPILLVKMKLILLLRSDAERVNLFKATHAFKVIQPATSVVCEFLVGPPALLADQERQLRLAVDVLSTSGERLLHTIRDLGMAHADEDNLLKIFADEYDDQAVYHFYLRDCLLQNPEINNLFHTCIRDFDRRWAARAQTNR
jgi:hypothetical protein